MQKLTIYKIDNKLYIKYKPSKASKPESVPAEVINYNGTLYEPIDTNNLPFEEEDNECPW